ncbi:MAG: DUF4115 domain-containing protein [Sulfuricellaceae bacterium]|nr:DUF4115 domain-containing protein [Sulfuricellaceae bacterium]
MNEQIPVNELAGESDDGDASQPVVMEVQNLGTTLKRAREQQNLRVEDVARELRLSVRQIEALERDDHAGLPGRTFVRGFVRHYARLVRLDQDAVVALYDQGHPSGEGLHIQVPSQQISYSDHHSRPWVKWILFVFVLVALLSWGVLQWMGPVQDIQAGAGDQRSSEPNTPPMEMSATSDQENAKPEATLLDAEKQASNPPVASVTPAVASPSSAGPAEQKVAALAKVSMTFSGSSWVEILDRNGKKLHSQNHEANSQADVEGEPPLLLVIGRAPNVKLSYKGQAFDLAPHMQGDIARFKLE